VSHPFVLTWLKWCAVVGIRDADLFLTLDVYCAGQDIHKEGGRRIGAGGGRGRGSEDGEREGGEKRR